VAHVKWLGITSIVLAMALMACAASFQYGNRMQKADRERDVAYAQAMLAFDHYKSYERIEAMLARKCYEAAMTETHALKNEQLVLLAENLRATGNDPELVEYVRKRDPQVLAAVLAGKVPQLSSYTTTCP